MQYRLQYSDLASQAGPRLDWLGGWLCDSADNGREYVATAHADQSMNMDSAKAACADPGEGSTEGDITVLRAVPWRGLPRNEDSSDEVCWHVKVSTEAGLALQVCCGQEA